MLIFQLNSQLPPTHPPKRKTKEKENGPKRMALAAAEPERREREREGKRMRVEERQRGDRVNEKMACKITVRYSRGTCAGCNHSRFQQLDSSHAEATFSRSYLPYGSLFG